MRQLFLPNDISGASSAAAASSMWWASSLCNPQFSHCKGIVDESAIVLASLLSRGTERSEEAIIQFQELLESLIEAQLKGMGRASGAITLSTTSTPDHTLALCAKKSGIGLEVINWTWHVNMQVSFDKVTIKALHNKEEYPIWISARPAEKIKLKKYS